MGTAGRVRERRCRRRWHRRATIQSITTTSIGVVPTAYYPAGQESGSVVTFVASRARLQMGNEACGWQAQLHCVVELIPIMEDG
ncbi:hypothetical protein MRX96_011349 [Rhipicephalus microplus]